MNKFRKTIFWLSRREYSGLALLVILTLVMHFSTITNPDRLVFDEKYYIPDGIAYIMEGDGTVRIEHPPLGKLFIVAGMVLFGENEFGWRFFSVIAGTICIVLFYLICRRLGLSSKVSFLATFLLSFENMTFIQASVGMLDVFSLTFMLLSFWLYLRGQYFASGISIGLGALAKLSGALALPIIMVHWLFANRLHAKRFLFSMMAAPVSFIVLMPLFDYIIWRKFLNPFSQIDQMVDASREYTFNSASSPDMLSRAWDWIFRPEILTFWDDPNYVSMISPTLWALIIPVIGYLSYRSWRNKGSIAIFALSWFACSYFFWVAVSLFTDRISYIYYFYPIIGSVCIGLAVGIEDLGLASRISGSRGIKIFGRIVIPLFLLAHLIAFAILVPVPYWWKVPACIVVYIFARKMMQTGALRNG